MPDHNLESFGNHMRRLRLQRKLSQEKMAELASLHRTYVGDIERGIRNPTLLSLVKIAKALNVALPELVSFSPLLADPCNSFQEAPNRVCKD